MTSTPTPPHPRTAPSRDALLAVHDFPGEFIIKVFGPGPEQSDFNTRAAALAREVIRDEARITTRERVTPSGAKVCVTLEMHVLTVEEVEQVYARLYTLRDLLMIL
ncbi:MAG: DUF493 family protein [Myxococcales bacterium]|nr:DUF493 family protein [Myxococcales bacterium]MCB9749531.1 DUF493 family protein [Myxococcales bacterium]